MNPDSKSILLNLIASGLFATVAFIIRHTRRSFLITAAFGIILSSLQMGFRTLAIQKRSSEVWNLLSAVKTEWTKYGNVLDAVQRKVHQASDTIEKARVRSRAVGRRLKDVQELPVREATALLPLDTPEAGGEPGEDDSVGSDET